jgi:hypothetical protein
MCGVLTDQAQIAVSTLGAVIFFGCLFIFYAVDIRGIIFLLVIVVLSTFIVMPPKDTFLVVMPEEGGIKNARVIESIGFLEHPFADKLIHIHFEYSVETNTIINTNSGRKFTALSHKKVFRVINPIAVYHGVGASDEIIENHLRDSIKRCFRQEISVKKFSSMLVQKVGDPFFTQSRTCELGLTHYGFKPIGGNEISFVDFQIADIPPIRLRIE